ncbi:MAG: hypothetical protein P8X90_34485 [Desulfobacterales bacterium]|jgi:hypothetical protein
MKYGAYYNPSEDDIVWFRTARPLEAGFYRRHARGEEPPDVYIADSLPELIMKVYPWIHKEETSFQDQVRHPGGNAEEQSRISEKMTGQLVQRLHPDDDRAWVDEPHWVKHLHTAS